MVHITFDTETTGLPRSRTNPDVNWVDWCRLVSIAWHVWDDDGTTCIKSSYRIVRPVGFRIPGDATAIHNITHAHAESVGESVDDVLDAFMDDVGQIEDVTLVAHNYEFDQGVVIAELARAKRASDVNAMKAVPMHCTMANAVALSREKYPKLSSLYEAVTGKPLEGNHHAEIDSIACNAIFLRQRQSVNETK